MADDDTSPFLLRCVVSYRHFLRLLEFRAGGLASDREFQLYVWPTTTLREVANLVYTADPRLSRPMSLHDFRVVSLQPETGMYEEHAFVDGVTRIGKRHVDVLLRPALSAEENDAYALLREADRDEIVRARKGDPSQRTLRDLAFRTGDILECVVDHTSHNGRPAATGLPESGETGHGMTHGIEAAHLYLRLQCTVSF
ncbi:hypothetical protein MSPP1_003347 [Malassezia sp. CBS 17886]|nr:hypothetical protein MSPP1_003347 [Malassezia sp. CBS 17886]